MAWSSGTRSADKQGQLDADVSVPVFGTPEPRKPVEDDDFSDNSIYR